MAYKVSHPAKKISGTINLPSSKSESNRMLMIRAISGIDIDIQNISPAKDTATLKAILEKVKNTNHTGAEAEVFDVGHAGTTMRFLTAYFSCLEGERILTGSDRMKKRPIGELVDALRKLGADIQYMEEKGFPPLKIIGGTLHGGEIEMKGSISSQFISALLLISPLMERGLVLKFTDEVVSVPYINMTLHMMEQHNVYGVWEADSIHVSKQNYELESEEDKSYYIEGDWSSASYLFSLVALSKEAEITVQGLKEDSLQGDSVVRNIFDFFGVKHEWKGQELHLSKMPVMAEQFQYDFEDCPDLAQTIAVVVSALKISSIFTGLKTLRIKETDRAQALQNELGKFGVKVEIISDNEIKLEASNFHESSQPIATYQDHRMALSFAPLALLHDIVFEELPDVVQKSYPGYWEDMKRLGFVIEQV
ncbi:MAG: 3-phosphoshikimate 1-carboxyvinyltransferase [Bacteroidia bacterium]